MKLTCDQPDLAAALQAVGRAVTGNTGMPVLANVHLHADDKTLTLTGTDLSTAVRVRMAAQVEQAGAITLPARLFTSQVKKLGGGVRVALTLDDQTQRVTLDAGPYTATISGIKADDFPSVSTIDPSWAAVTIPWGALGNVVSLVSFAASEVSFAASDDETRPALTGVLFRFGQGELAAVAADGYRLALLREAVEVDEGWEVLLPARTVRLLDGLREDAVMATSPEGNQVIFHTPGMDIVSRLIDGQFPAFERIIPTGHVARAVVPVKAMADALARVHDFAQEGQGFLSLTIRDGALVLSAKGGESGSGAEVLEAQVDGAFEGERVVGVNVKFLTQAVRCLGTDLLDLRVQQSDNPVVIRREGDEVGYLHVIMPMTLR